MSGERLDLAALKLKAQALSDAPAAFLEASYPDTPEGREATRDSERLWRRAADDFRLAAPPLVILALIDRIEELEDVVREALRSEEDPGGHLRALLENGVVLK